MNRSAALLLLFFLATFVKARSFNTDNGFEAFRSSVFVLSSELDRILQVRKDTVFKAPAKKKHSPKKATVYSMVLPGLGQAYNRKYWKIPVIYTCLVGTGAFLRFSHVNMMERQDALIAIKDGDPNTNPTPKYARISEEQLKADRDYYRANRDYAIIALAIFYTLNVIDAMVDAHFYQFNIDKPLALQKKRHFYAYASEVRNLPTIGVAYRF